MFCLNGGFKQIKPLTLQLAKTKARQSNCPWWSNYDTNYRSNNMYKASSKEYFDDIVYVDKAIKLRVHLSFFDGHCSRVPCCYSHTTLVDISKLRCVIHLIGKRNSKGCKSNLQVIVANNLLHFLFFHVQFCNYFYLICS